MAMLTGVSAAGADESLMYVGTYTGQGSEGIYAWRFNSKTGTFKSVGLVGKSNNPSFIAIAPNQKFLYAANELSEFKGARAGAVTAFSINPTTGALTELNQVSARGDGTCFVSVDHAGRVVLIANYSGGSIASFHVQDGGQLSEAVSFIQHKGSSADRSRQGGPHAHSINVSPDNRFAISADLGTDELNVYRLDAATGTLTANDPPAMKMKPGDGPRHFTFDPKGRFAYVINEISSTVTALKWDGSRGVLTSIESVSTLPADFHGENSTAEVQVHPSGKWLYGSNRGHDSIAVFAIDRNTGKLKLVQNAPTGGSQPRNFRIDPSGKWLIAANHKGNNIRLFRINSKTGQLTPSGEMLQLNSPVCIKFLASR
jgi:6-phosphogluconolactonase